MDFWKKYFKVFFIIIITVCSINVASATTNSAISESACGVDNDVVKPYNGEICEQDVSFNVLYQMFPTTLEEFVFPILNPEYLTLVPELEEQNKFIYQTRELIFYEIFKSSINISYLIIGIFLTWHFLILGLLRSANDGSFLGNSWKTSSVLMKYGLLTILLLPVSTTGILVIHVLLLTLIVIGIYFANFFWGVYLSYLQVGENTVDLSSLESSAEEQESLRLEEFEENISKYDHNYFYAFSQAKKLTEIAVCKQRTEKLMYQLTLPFASATNINDFKTCIENTSSSAWDSSVISNTDTQSFIHYSNQINDLGISEAANPSDETQYFVTSKINFGNKDYGQCSSNDNREFDSENYSCGSVIVSPVLVPEGSVKTAIENSNFYDQYLTASEALDSDGDPYSTISSSWDSVYLSVDTLFEDGEVLSDYKHNKVTIYKSVSYIFHKSLMNDALVGNSNYSKPVVSSVSDNDVESTSRVNTTVFNAESNFNLRMTSYFSDALDVASAIEKYSCVSNTTLYTEAQNAADLISGYQSADPENISSYNTVCLDLETNTPIGFNPKSFIKGDDTGQLLREKQATERNAAITEGQEALLSLTQKIYEKRNGIEKSFYKSIISLPSNDMVNKLRKQGWGVSGGYMLKLMSEKELDNKLSHALKNTATVTTEILTDKGFPDESIFAKYGEGNTETLKDWGNILPAFEDIIETLKIKPLNKNLKYVDVSQYVDDNIFDNVSKQTDGDGFLDLFNIFNLGNKMKSIVGIGADGEFSLDEIKSCIEASEDSSESCPINLTNPIVDISKLGHDLINISFVIIGLTATAALLEYRLLKKSADLEINGGNGSINEGSSGDDQNVDNKKNQDVKNSKKHKLDKKSKNFKILEKISGLFSILIQLLLSASFLLLTVGMTLAYVIPLIPFIAFTIAFISWIVISLEILIIAPIWLGFLFRLEDTQNQNSELYRAGFNFAMQMLFRPALIIISIIVGWSFFSILFFIINLSIAPFIGSYTSSSFFSGLIYGALMLIAYAFVIFVCIKQIFDLMITLPNKIFTKIGVQPFDSSYESNAKDTLSKFTMGGVGVSAAMGKSAENLVKSKKEIRNDVKKKQKERLEKETEAVKKDNDRKKEQAMKENEDE